MTKEEFENKPSASDKKSPEELENKPSASDELSNEEKNDDNYKFGWSSYSERINGRFAMIGFLAIILIELFSQEQFLKWAGIL